MKKTKIQKAPDLKIEELKTGQVYRSKKPKLIGFFEPLVDDRQILHISQFRSVVDYIDHGYNPEFEEWCNKKQYSTRTSSSYTDQLDFEAETGKSHKNIECVWEHTIQYDSPSVKDGKNYPAISASKFIKWAEKNITEIMPKGEWRKSL